MAIHPDDVSQDYALVNDSQTGEQALDAARGKKYIVVRFTNEQYAVFTPGDLEMKLARWKALTVPLAMVPANAFIYDLVATIDPRLENAADADKVNKAKVGTLFALVAEGRFAGVFIRPAQMRSLPLPQAPPPPKPSAELLEEVLEIKRLETAELPSLHLNLSANEPQAQAPTPVEAEKRFINAQLEDHDKNQPLQMGQAYTLAFDVDVEARAEAVQVAAFESKTLFKDSELIDLTVQLTSDDFAVNSEPQKLRVPKFGKSKNKARFDIEPKHEGEGILNAVFLKDGAFIQLMTLKLKVGGAGPARVGAPTTLGHAVDAATSVKPRDVSLTILNNGANFTLIFAGAVAAQATIPLNVAALQKFVEQVRQELLGVVYTEYGANKTRVYQAALDIPSGVNTASLQRLAKAGWLLYDSIFNGDNAGADLKMLGDTFRQLAQRQKLRVQIYSQEFMLPWGLLYMADDFDPDHVDPNLFLGLKHVVEHIPLQQNMQVLDEDIATQPQLTVSLNVNKDIDQQMGAPFIQNQITQWSAWGQKGEVKVVTRETAGEVLNALADPTTADKIWYFYCHAVSKSIAEAEGPGSSTLVFTGNQRVTLDDLKARASTKKTLSAAPLVFINACESAELSPLFYGGFVTYFMAKGARGVIGTECETPALFAAEFAKQFFTRFLSGTKTVGEVFLELRQEFYAKHNNVLGLLYALYCNADTEVNPGVQVG